MNSACFKETVTSREWTLFSGVMNFKFNFRFHVLGFTVILCEENEMIQQVLITGPYEEILSIKRNHTKGDNPVFLKNYYIISSAWNCPWMS